MGIIRDFIVILTLIRFLSASSICDFSHQSLETAKIVCSCDPSSSNNVLCQVKSAEIQETDSEWEAAFHGKGQIRSIKLEDTTETLSYVPYLLFKYQRGANSITVKNAILLNLQSESFSEFSQLRTLTLKDNKIQYIAENAFKNLPELKVLDLSQNKILRLRQHSFVNLPKVYSINFSNNELFDIASGAFAELRELKYLFFQHNKFTKVHKRWWSGLVKIEIINFKENLIESLNENSFGDIPSLIKLVLANNHIAQINRATFTQLPKLKILDLSGNRLETLSEDLFVGLDHLIELNLSHNDMKTFYNNAALTIKTNLWQHSSANYQESCGDISLEGNHFFCNCDVKWMYDLQLNTTCPNVRENFNRVDCKTRTGMGYPIRDFPQLHLMC